MVTRDIRFMRGESLPHAPKSSRAEISRVLIQLAPGLSATPSPRAAALKPKKKAILSLF